MSWLILTQDFPPAFTGGIAHWAEDLATALAQAGEEVVVMARSTGDTRRHDQACPYKVVRMHGRSWGRLQGLWAGLQAVGRVSSSTRIVAATWPLATGLLPLVRATGAWLGVACHGSDLTRLGTCPEGLQRVAGRASAFLPVSRFLAGELDRLGVSEAVPRHVLPMPLPIPVDPIIGPRAGLVMLARLTQLKGLDRALALADGLGMKLTVIGDGPARAAVRGSGSLAMMGRLPREAAMRHMARARGCVLLPRTDKDGTGAEGLGLCLLEAAARGTPVIGCRTGGVPEAVGPGLLLDDPDRPRLKRIRAFLLDPASGEAARSWVKATHGPEACVAALRAAAS